MIPILCFFVSLKFGGCYSTGQLGEFTIQKVTLCFHLLFFLFFIIKCFFNYLLYHFIIISFFQIKYQISATEYIKQSETGIGGPKFLVELHGIFETNATTPLTWVDEKLSLDQSAELGIF